jgi:hypothetical protein
MKLHIQVHVGLVRSTYVESVNSRFVYIYLFYVLSSFSFLEL